jgi:two-component system, OmpR family, phosphate regulon sensor histidine kinase PhoR
MMKFGSRLLSKVILAYILLGAVSAPILWLTISRSIENYLVRSHMTPVQVDEAMWHIKYQAMAGAFILFIAAVVMGVFLSRRLTRRADRMAAFTGKIASGDFSSRIAYEGKDELGVLAENLNLMAGQLKKNVEALSKEKVILTAVLKGMADGVMVTDAQGRVMIVNPAFLNTFGIKEESAVGRPLVEVIRNEGIQNLYKSALRVRDYVSGEVETGFPEPMYFIAGCVPLIIEDVFSGIVIVLHDVTRMQALERVRRDFVANVTHELKTPIAAIQGFAETLMDGALDDKERANKFLGIIESNSQRLARLVEDLMTLSKIELGEVKLHMKPVSIKEVALEAAALLEPKIKERNIKLALDFSPDMPLALADKDKLYQIILNVMDNAVKYTPRGESVTVAGKAGEAGGTVEISITDTGPGIPPEMLPRMGERFFRVDPARSRELGGTGLGLAIVKHLVRIHGGSFNIESLVRRGTKVTFTFKSSL